MRQEDEKEGVSAPSFKVDLAGMTVMLGMPSHRDLPPQTNSSILSTWDLMARHGVELKTNVVNGSSLVQVARNRVAHEFLQSDANRLFWVDSDMSWKAEDFLRFVAMSSELEVVGASYPIRKDPIQFCVRGYKDGKIYEGNNFGCITDSEMGFGLGFTIVQRKVIEELAAKAKTTILPDMGSTIVSDIFRTGSVVTARSVALGADGEFMGEDMHFFEDVKKLGYKVWLDPSVDVSHIGQKEYKGSLKETLSRTTDAA